MTATPAVKYPATVRSDWHLPTKPVCTHAQPFVQGVYFDEGGAEVAYYPPECCYDSEPVLLDWPFEEEWAHWTDFKKLGFESF